MNKSQFIAAIAQKSGLSQKNVGKILEAYAETVGNALKQGQDVVLLGFGTFKISEREERIGRNPKTGAPLKIPAARLPKFKPGKMLKEAVA